MYSQRVQLVQAHAKVSLQVECHPYFRNDKLLEWCKSHGIHVTAYSPLGSPDSASLFKRAAPLLLQDPTLRDIAAKIGKSPAQVCFLFWCEA